MTMKTLTFLTACLAFTTLSAQTKQENIQWAAEKMANQFCECQALSIMLDVRIEETQKKTSQQQAAEKILPYLAEVENCLAPFAVYNAKLNESEQVEAANTMRLIMRNQCPKIADKFDAAEGKK
jgi:hypothetical protein